MRLLSRHRCLDIEPHHRVNIEDLDVAIGVGPHYLNYTMYVSACLGLDALLPNIGLDHTWQLQLNFSMIQCLWPDSKATHLLFDNSGHMMYIGRRLQEYAWIAMVPNEWLVPDHPINATGAWPHLNAPTSAMTTKHALMLVMFMAHAFSTLRFQDFSCRVMYPEPLTCQKVNSVTNILPGEQHRIVDLRLCDLQALHRHLLDEWIDWVEHVPDTWKTDRFLLNNTPVAVAMMYGQNQQILHPNMAAIEPRNWRRDRDYTHIKLFRISITTHINHMEVLQWDDIPVRQLIANHPVTYNTTDDDDTVPRTVTASSGVIDFIETGCLLNLSKAHALFEPQAENNNNNPFADDAIDPAHAGRAVKYTLYPLAFTKKYGNLQVDGVIPPFARKHHQLDEEDHDDHQHPRSDSDLYASNDMDIDQQQPQPHRAVTPHFLHSISCQIYNAISHRVRDAAKFHEVQLGLLTSALAGCTAQTIPAKNHWQHTVGRVHEALPHAHFAEKVKSNNQPQSMHFENTYQLDIQSLPPGNRVGDFIFTNIVKPLARLWAHPSVLRPVKDACIILKKDIVPELFQCTTYPLTSLIEHLWDSIEPSLALSHIVDPCTLETIAMLEHTLNYGHTGSVCVLTHALMDRAWLGLSVLNNGLPSITGSFITAGSLSSGMIAIQKDRWPVHPVTCLPLTASQCSQELTYGKCHYVSYLTAFTINITMKHMPVNEHSNGTNDHGLRVTSYAADIVLRSLIGDITALVRSTVLNELTPIITEGGLEAVLARKHKRALLAWLDSPHPLSINNNALPHLIEAIVIPLNGHMDLTKSIPASTPLLLFIRDILTHCNRDRPRQCPPFIHDSHFLHIARAAIHEVTTFACTRLGFKKEDADVLVERGFVAACHSLKIHQVSWSAPPPEGCHAGPGAPSQRVIHNAWMNLGTKNPTTWPPTSAALLAHARTPAALACQTSARMIAEEPSGDWLAIEITLKHFHTVLHKTVLPREHLVQRGLESQASVEPYILEAFEYACTSYNLDNPIHLLALFTSITCAGLLPAIFATNADLKMNKPGPVEQT
ncbi:hypothetical protein J3R83DRAFT_5416 [Lanmaoa asiatica]|nr:hypothetical protein J3R83DRAFT_5416 [Lanmaoa asiatica]